jgi:PilZ domain
MEHREGARIPVSFHVELQRGSQSFGRSLAANIGQGGLFLSGLDGEVVEGEVAEGDLLTLKISNNASAKRSNFERKAMVVHFTDKGVGLMWTDNYSNFLTKVHCMGKMAA